MAAVPEVVWPRFEEAMVLVRVAIGPPGVDDRGKYEHYFRRLVLALTNTDAEAEDLAFRLIKAYAGHLVWRHELTAPPKRHRRRKGGPVDPYWQGSRGDRYYALPPIKNDPSILTPEPTGAPSYRHPPKENQ